MFVANGNGVAWAINEAESLTLLVETLNSTDDANIRSALMRGMLRGLEGRRNLAAPQGWSELGAKLAKSENGEVRDLANQLSQIFGDLAAMKR